MKHETKWLLCPVCGNKTRDRIRSDTVLINYPLYCPKCKQETLINAKDFIISVIPQQVAQPAGAVNGQDERRTRAAVDSPAAILSNKILPYEIGAV